jgi:hypothetical protein
MRTPLDWTFLEIEEDEWNQVVAASGAAAAPTSTPQPYSSRPSLRSPTLIPWRQVLFAAAWALALVAACAFVVWRQAEQGIARMEGDVSVAVKAEALTARAKLPAQGEQAQVESVEFLDGKAMAQVVVTRTLSSDHFFVQRETRFFAQTPKGWTRVKPVAAFWGAKESLELEHLRFVFRAKDREIARQVAPEAEAYYIAVHRVLAANTFAVQPQSDTALTIELLPELVIGGGRQCRGWIGLTSPLLYKPDTIRVRQDILAALLRDAVLRYVLDYDRAVSQPRLTWHPLYSGVHLWLLSSDSLPLATGPRTADATFVVPVMSARLFHLCIAATDAGSKPSASCDPAENPRDQGISSWYQDGSHNWTLEVASGFVDFIAATYGVDALGAIVQGLSCYGDWESLAQVTLGVSADELEAAWQAYAAGTQGAIITTQSISSTQD